MRLPYLTISLKNTPPRAVAHFTIFAAIAATQFRPAGPAKFA